MKKYFIFVLLFFTWQCNPPQPSEKLGPFFIYDSNQLFRVYENSNDTLDYLYFKTRKSIHKYVDTFLVAENYKYYQLYHYFKYLDYKDTSFVKHKTYLDNLDYFDAEWLDKEINLDSFWLPVNCWRCFGIYDTLEIYLIRPVENADSIIFQQVHRQFHQTQ